MSGSQQKKATNILVDNVTIDLPVFDFSQRSLKNAILSKAGNIGGVLQYKEKSTHALVRAIRNLTFEVKAGERVAIIGHNGAGKSTLLRALAGIYHPTKGHIHIQGNVLPIFDISLGMDFESTGYENIYLRSLYLGAGLEYSEQLVEDVLGFSELGEFAALPIRTYSTGMLARLQFAITTAMRPDILIMDEGIGAGDASFFAKAQDRLTEMMEGAGIMILATHSEGLVKSICNKAILMEKGQMIAQGDTDDVWKTYIDRAAKV